LLVGQIPSSIGQSTTLQSIDLTSNQLTGTIPDFASQSKIMQLWLANNKFTGHIPVTTGKLSALQLLDLSANHLTATIPTEIGNCQKIIHFGVNENSLSGTINQVIDLLPSTLESLDASGNLLEGTIPVSVGTLAKVSFLDLQENKVGGTLPSEIGLLSELETLNLAYNKFTGSVPLTLANLSNLVDLRLQGNSLNGSLDWLCIIDFEFFAANTCSEPDEIECTCCTVCCDLGEAYCESIV
jgi:Leucine-rich repeat (LRR) protein